MAGDATVIVRTPFFKLVGRRILFTINPAIKYVIPAVAKRRAGIYNMPYFLDSRFRRNDSGT